MQALYPQQLGELDDEAIIERYRTEARPFVRFNFVSSLDGSAQYDGLSEGLGSPADARAFALMRRLASVILVGAGTVRAEGYAGPLVDEQSQQWRTAHGLPAHPVLAIISRGLNIEPDAEVLRQSPAPVLLFTTVPVTAELTRRYPQHVQLVQLTERGHWCNASQVVEELHGRGLGFIHAEGGPHVFGQFVAQDMVDSLCLSFTPLLVAGTGTRITRATEQAKVRLPLHSVLEEDGTLLTEYRRGPARPGPGTPAAP